MPTYQPGTLGPLPRDPEQKFWDPEIQTMPRERLADLQLSRLQELVDKVLKSPAPLFERKLREAGVERAEDIASVDDVNSIPTTIKQELRDSEADEPPFGDYRFTDPRECVRLGTSTGTTGTPTIALFTRHDIWLEYESAARVWWRNGWRPGQIVTHAHPAYLYGGGVMLSGSLEYFGALNMWVAPPDTDELAEQGINMWRRLNPDVSMVAFNLGRFQEVAAKMGLDLRTDVGLPGFEMKGFSDRGFPMMTAGLECYAYAGGPCGVDPGGHIHEDWAIVQALDPKTGRDVPDGEWGNLVVTTLDRDNGLLRYDLEEAITLMREPCSCGETTIRGFWGGRFKDFLDCQGKYFQVGEIERALRTVDEVTQPTLEYVVVKPTEPDAPLRLRVELLEGDTELARGRCVAAIKEAVGVEAEVEIVERESLARSGYKATRLVDR
jgi:phenylacetate-CoA ligase